MTSNLFAALQQIDADKSFSDEEIEKLDNLEKSQKRIEKREKRKADCGNWSNWYDPHTGRRTGFTFRCGLFRMCPSCLTERADVEYEWMQQTSLDKRMVVTELLDPKEATKMLRGVDKTDYVRYPQEEGGDLIIVNEDVGISGRGIDLEWVVNQDWEEIVKTPAGRNKSGTIHVPVSDEDVEEFSIITTTQFITSATRQETIHAMDLVVEETRGLNPTTPDEVVDALQKRISMATSKLKQAGFTVHMYSKQLKLIHSKIDWGAEVGFRVNKRIYTENPTRLRARVPEKVPIGI